MSQRLPVLARRLSCSLIARYVWEAIDFIHHQRQFVNFQRIYCYMNRVHGINEERLTVEIEHCVRDGLLVILKKVGNRGSKVGVEQEEYVLPTIFERDSHDWYCFECHLSGEVVSCTSCFRVYHITCVKASVKTGNEFVCNMCSFKNDSAMISLGRLNQLLSYVFKNLKKLLPTSEIQLWQKNESERIRLLIYKPMDFNLIHYKILSAKYSHLEQFRADMQTVLHNIVIYEGEQSSITTTVKSAVNDCARDIKEIQLCADCYQTSHEKNDELWFCKPCHPPHELVFAQVKGYPFWPAKVMEKIKEQYDVRFFGSNHQRAIIEKEHVKPITENIEKFQKSPKSVSWRKACSELRQHQMLLQNGKKYHQETPERCDRKRRKTKEVLLNKKKRPKVRSTTSLQNSSKHFLKDFLPIKRQNSIFFKRKKIEMGIQCKSKGRYGWKRKRIEKNARKEPQKDNTITASSAVLVSVGTQTHCSTGHQHQKYVLNLEKNEQLEFSEQYNMKDVISHIMDNQKNEDGCQSYSENHAFCNTLCPLNKCRKKIISDLEIENEIEKAIAVATDIINAKYGEIVDNMAQSHMKIIQEIQKRVWCVICHQEANIHCCWNVDYCSQKCQNEHWKSGHGNGHMQKDIL